MIKIARTQTQLRVSIRAQITAIPNALGIMSFICIENIAILQVLQLIFVRDDGKEPYIIAQSTRDILLISSRGKIESPIYGRAVSGA